MCSSDLRFLLRLGAFEVSLQLPLRQMVEHNARVPQDNASTVPRYVVAACFGSPLMNVGVRGLELSEIYEPLFHLGGVCREA